MPRYYCDYCDTYLTHDSPSVRTQHNAGYKHKANVRAYYQQFEEQQTQSLIDQKVKEHLGQTGGGTVFQQHLAALQAGQYKPPVLGAASGILASSQPPLLNTIRLPVLPLPTAPASGFNSTPGQYHYRANPAGNSQSNGVPTPPTLTPLGALARPTGPPSNPPSYGSYNYGSNTPASSRSGTPSSNSSYMGQQPLSGPPGSQGMYPYGAPGAQMTQNSSYGPPGAPVGYRS